LLQKFLRVKKLIYYIINSAYILIKFFFINLKVPEIQVIKHLLFAKNFQKKILNLYLISFNK